MYGRLPPNGGGVPFYHWDGNRSAPTYQYYPPSFLEPRAQVLSNAYGAISSPPSGYYVGGPVSQFSLASPQVYWSGPGYSFVGAGGGGAGGAGGAGQPYPVLTPPSPNTLPSTSQSYYFYPGAVPPPPASGTSTMYTTPVSAPSVMPTSAFVSSSTYQALNLTGASVSQVQSEQGGRSGTVGSKGRVDGSAGVFDYLFPRVDGSTLSLSIERQPVKEGTDITLVGGVVWNAAKAFGQWAASNASFIESIRGQRIVELGAGTGLSGLVLASLGAASVTLTDLPECLPLLERNVERNSKLFPGCKVRVEALPWGECQDGEASIQQLLDEGFDLVVGSDVTYTASVKFVYTLGKLCEGAGGVPALICHERRWEHTDESFGKAFARRGFMRQDIPYTATVEDAGPIDLFYLRLKSA